MKILSLNLLKVCLGLLCTLIIFSKCYATPPLQNGYFTKEDTPLKTSTVKSSVQTLAELPTPAQEVVSEALGRDNKAYHISTDEFGLRADNIKQGFKVTFSNDAATIFVGANSWELKFAGLGYGENMQYLPCEQIVQRGNRLEYYRDSLTEWYINGPFGLEQGFTVSRKPESENGGLLTIGFVMSGGLKISVDANHKGLTAYDKDGATVFHYGGLRALDSDGKELKAKMEVTGSRLLVKVDDSNAKYPLVIDPLVHQSELTGAAGDDFGISVALSTDGNTALIGANSKVVGANQQQGGAYVFTRAGTVWSQQTVLTANDGASGDAFGISVSLSSDGSTALIGADTKNVGSNQFQGAAYVFTRSGTVWSQQTKLTASDGISDDCFGFSVSLSGDGNTALVGKFMFTNPTSNAGEAYVFTRSGVLWAQQAKLSASDAGADDSFGCAVSLSGDGNTALIGANFTNRVTGAGYSIGGRKGGRAYVFIRSGTVWTQQVELASADGAIFGESVALSYDGNTALVGDSAAGVQGEVYVFAHSGTEWPQQAKLSVLGARLFGVSLSISTDGNTAIIGRACGLDLGTYSDQGAAYIFTRSGTAWVQQAPLIASDGTVGDLFGSSISLSGDGLTALIGASNTGINASTRVGTGIAPQGTAYVFSGQSGYLSITPKWSYTTGDQVDFSSPAIGSDGTVYVGSADDYLYAINNNGTLKWRYKTNGPIESSPAIGSDGTVYVGSDDDYLYAINSNGTLKWSYNTNSLIESSPAIGSDGTVYVGSDNDYLYAINSNGTLKWSYKTNGEIDSSPAIGSDGTVYVGSWDDYLYAINSNGTLKWSYATGWIISSSPAIGSDGTVYVGSYDDNLYAINTDGTLKWSYKTGGSIISSSPAIGSDGTIYVGSGDNKLYAINSNGTLKWSYNTGYEISSSPAIGIDGTVYVGSGNVFYAINSDGTYKWSYATGSTIWASSAAIGNDGTVYIGSEDDKLYAFNGGLALRNSPWPMFHHDLRHTGIPSTSLIAAVWTQITGAIISPPAIAWNPSLSEIQMVVRGSNNSIWTATFNSDGSFNNDWTQIPGAILSPPAIAWNPVSSRMQMIVQGSGDSIWSSTFNSSGTFNNDWTQIPGAILSPPAIAWNPVSSRMQMIVQGSGDSIWSSTFNSSGTFNNDWTQIPGAILSPPSIVWNSSNNDTQMVVQGSANTVWSATFNSSGAFDSDWIQIPGAVTSSPALAWNPVSNNMQMIVQGSGNTVWSATFKSTGVFNNDWSQIPGATIDQPAIVWNPVKGNFLIVVRGTNNSIWVMEY